MAHMHVGRWWGVGSAGLPPPHAADHLPLAALAASTQAVPLLLHPWPGPCSALFARVAALTL